MRTEKQSNRGVVMLGNVAEGLMLTGGGMIVGSWLALWVEPSNHKLNVIRIAVCGAISIAAFTFWVEVGSISTLLLVAEKPFLGMIAVSVIVYSAFVVAIEPIWLSMRRKFELSTVGIKEALGSSAKGEGDSKEVKDRSERGEAHKGWLNRVEPMLDDRNLSERLMDEGKAYVAKAQMLTPSEQLAYQVIEQKYGNRFYIFSQVRVIDLIQPNSDIHPKGSREHKALFKQLSQWHFDFLLCYRDNFSVCCAIELDDPSRPQTTRLRRDRILNRACKAAGVRLERMRINYKEKRIERISQ